MRFSLQLLRILALGAVLTAMVACSGNKGNVVSSAKILNSNDTPQGKAESLALSGEKIAYGPGFMYANQLFDLALQQDPNNVRARFYKALLTPAMDMKGILARVEPVVKNAPPEAQANFNKQIAQMAAGDVKSFLLNGQPDITNEKGVQDFVRTIQQAMRDSRQAIQGLGDQTLTIHVLSPVADTTTQDVLSHCQVNQLEDGDYEVQDCDIYEKHDYNLNYADFEALNLAIGVYEIYFGEGTLYDLTGSEAIARKLDGVQWTPQQLIGLVKSQPQLLKLADSSTFQDILSMGEEGSEAIRIALSKQDELCRTGDPNGTNRPGFLFWQGFCTTKELLSWVPLVQAGLHGPVQVSVDAQDPYGYPSTYTTTVNATKLLGGSITDLKALLPNQFDGCGNPIGLPDTTMGGTFPQSDYVTFERAQDPSFLQEYCPVQTK